MPVLRGISYEEMEGSGRMTYRREQGLEGTRIFIVAWPERAAFIEALRGYSESIGDMAIRIPGQRFPGYDNLYCQDIDIEPIGELSQGPDMASYDNARVTAVYRPWNFGTSTRDEEEDYEEDEEERLARLTEEWDFGGEFLTVPSGTFFWPGDEPVDASVGLMVGTADIILTSDEEPLLNRALIGAALGKVNSRTWYGFATGKVLYLGAAARRIITAEGSTAWTLTHRFRAKTHKWNEFWEPGVGGGWAEIKDADGNPPYASFDFYNIF